jgi:hypothetical protein
MQALMDYKQSASAVFGIIVGENSWDNLPGSW